MRQTGVIEYWLNNDIGAASNFFTDGTNLYSYGLKIGTTVNEEKIVFDYTKDGGEFKSQSTTRHVNLAKGAADRVVSPTIKLY